ncbi:hypothetical protein MMC12_000141 [Toensbergia leucococca]|nr:hypothetical protein [Toensbergia leucococca]
MATIVPNMSHRPEVVPEISTSHLNNPSSQEPNLIPEHHVRSIGLEESPPPSSSPRFNNPIPQEPTTIAEYHVRPNGSKQSPPSSLSSVESSPPSSDSEPPDTPRTDTGADVSVEKLQDWGKLAASATKLRRRRASTRLIVRSPEGIQRAFGDEGARTQLVDNFCCGGGCCFLLNEDPPPKPSPTVTLPDNEAFRSLHLNFGSLSIDMPLTNVAKLPLQVLSFETLHSHNISPKSAAQLHPPNFVTPHPPYDVYSAKVHHARELTKGGAEKRTYHFDLDVTDYPDESGNVDFVVGGAIGVCAPNSEELVDEIFDVLNIPNYKRDKKFILKTESGRWPTIWGEEMARELITTRRELLTWCSDVQSYPPTKALLRLLGEYASSLSEKKILYYLTSAQGQAAFCDLRTGPHITIAQLLHAFPSSQPPLPHLLSVLNTLMPRFYSLSSDPQTAQIQEGRKCRRLIEIAVTVHETPNWRGGPRTGLGSGYLERVAQKIVEAENKGANPSDLDFRIPIFRGLMANPLAREYVSDGPMLLIGAGVGVAPFRGFVQRRLKSANCANKVWVLQGVRDSLLDELYSGEWGVHEEKVKKVVQSRRGEGRYVQEEVRAQADLVWFIINALDGRVFVCGSSQGMGEGVEAALVDVAMDKGTLNKEEATQFWAQKKKGGQYIAVSVTYEGRTT